jgi:elongation factor P--beta-lysine ligase
MQSYSLCRFRLLKPPPPFFLGGIFVRLEGRSFIKDAVEMLEFEGETSDLNDGDLVQLAVEAVEPEGPRIGAVHKLYSTRSQKESRPKPHALEFAAFVAHVRGYFLELGLQEIFTPALVVCPGLEPSLEPFASGTKFLPTSPEIHLKKAMSEGFTDLFEIKPCFRDKENSPQHAAEFLMLEWYRGFADLEAILTDLSGLLILLQAPPLRVTTFKDLFREVLDFELTPRTSREEMRQLCEGRSLDILPHDTFSDLFHRLVIEHIEPAIARRGDPTAVRDFPPSEAALAKIGPEGWADRFELYWRGFEIANAFNRPGVGSTKLSSARASGRRWSPRIQV